MMKKGLCTILLAALLAMPSVYAAEEVRIVTDKSVYVAGEYIWCAASVYEDGRLSDTSAIAYVELVSQSGLTLSAKIALTGGRGCGIIPIPVSVPTGNYYILGYTALSQKAECRTLSVFNTGSKTRIKEGIVLSDKPMGEPEGLTELPDDIELNVTREDGSILLELRNKGGESRTLSLSVCEDDALRAPAGIFEASVKPGDAEADGEIVRARVYGKDASKVVESPWLTAVISCPGSPSDTYTGKISPDGTIVFKTNNIYGDRDLVCEIIGTDGESLNCRFGPMSPFQVPEGLKPVALELSYAMKDALLARHLSAVNAKPGADTLFEFLPKRDNLLLSMEDCTVYHLDDFIRFNTVDDIVRELIPNLGVRRVHGRRQLKLTLADALVKTRTDNVLAMLDGVPVSNHENLLAFDALALSDVQVFPYFYALGGTVFSGVVNFVTTRHDMSALRFNDNVRILDFKGCSYPVAMKTPSSLSGTPAGRTLLWQPLVSIAAGETVAFRVPDTGAELIIRAD